MKKYNGSKCTSVLLKAFHPTNPQCADLHLKKRNELMICHVSLENNLPYFYQITGENQMGRILQDLLCKEPEELHCFGLKAQKWVTEHKNAKVQANKVVEMIG